MRQMASFGSVKAIWLNREEVIGLLKKASTEALRSFPAIKEIRLFGSIAKGEETGLSDIDLFLLVEDGGTDPLERMRPYFNFFSDRLKTALDMVVATEAEKPRFRDIIEGSVLLAKR